MLENAVLHPHIDGISLSARKAFMSATQRSEATLDRNQRREAEINEALKQEAARHAAAIKNMHRLRALRLAQDEKAKPAEAKTKSKA
ncbi:MAG TPA: hypothetical protein VGV62_00050 [Xanthobacteraceae bacterium]|jgi:hypothetical protein|nr:hypothetical protein [Xanthobacteraceae bacterium]